jgi:hypothetical protein
VRRERQLVRLRPGREAAQAREAAEVGEIGLNDVDEPLLDDRAEVREQVDALAGRDRSPRRAADACQRGRTVERNRLLEPGGGVRLELDRDLGGEGRL